MTTIEVTGNSPENSRQLRNLVKQLKWRSACFERPDKFTVDVEVKDDLVDELTDRLVELGAEWRLV
jgi:hypothetical protein